MNSSRIPGSVLSTAVNIAVVQGSVVKRGTHIVSKYSLHKKGVGQRRREQSRRNGIMIANNRRVWLGNEQKDFHEKTITELSHEGTEEIE